MPFHEAHGTSRDLQGQPRSAADKAGLSSLTRLHEFTTNSVHHAEPPVATHQPTIHSGHNQRRCSGDFLEKTAAWLKLPKLALSDLAPPPGVRLDRATTAGQCIRTTRFVLAKVLSFVPYLVMTANFCRSRRRQSTARLLLAALLSLCLLLSLNTDSHVSASSSRPPPALFKSSGSDSSKGAQFLQHVLSDPKRSSSSGGSDSSSQGLSEPICRPTGQIEDASCDYETVETINSQFFDRLDTLRKTDFFKYYKVNLFKECPFWNENGFCMNRACSVETEDEANVPEEYRVKRLSSVTTASPQDVVMVGSDSSCSCSSTEFCHLDDQDTEEGVYVDLLKNPERFTGYAGASANRVWKSIYEENCFNGVKFVEPARPQASGGTGFVDKSMLLQSSLGASGPAGGLGSLMNSLQAPLDSGDSEQCLEKRVFYRIISGLHASISIHICHDFLDTKTGEWAPNLECFITRIAEHPERLQNVYFDYVLLLRALSRLGDSSENFSLRAGDTIDDPLAVAQLDDVIRDARACPTTFDEARMFSGQNRESLELKQEFRQHFRNISAIMDCVGCDKCRLWGKLQINGVGTALKLLFNGNEEGAGKKQPVQLQRSELVALVNAAHRIAESLRAVETFRDMYQSQKAEALAAAGKKIVEDAAASTTDNRAAVESPASSKSPPSSSSTHKEHANQNAAQRVPPSRGTERLHQRRPKNASSPPDSDSASSTLPDPGQPWPVQLVSWLSARLEQSLTACRRSLHQCLASLGFQPSSTDSHSEL
ncbi:ERO1-domain-containing protein [Testicularia cyperi]|uniref:ERO1-domain-containing protein n=1 Tax=Testicularia cyperi TaxID=1882483 RepID=A0A317XNB2_9BASI|nr:ERO1-domain-containing protein [Testicularia cyperi]